MRELTTKTVAALAIVGLVVSGVGPALADYTGSPTIDTSTTDDTASTSDVAPGDTLGINHTFAGNSSKNKTFQWIAQTNETSISVERNGSSYETWGNETPSTVLWNATEPSGHFNATMKHSALFDSDHAAGANVTYDVTTVNNSTASTLTTTTDQIYVEWDNSTSVEHISTSDVSDGIDGLTVESSALSVGGFNLTAGPLGADYSSIEATDRTVNGSETDVYVTFADSNVTDDFNEAAADASSAGKLSGFSWTRNVVLVEDADGNVDFVPVYNEEAPDSVDASSTYAVYKTDAYGGSDGVMVNLGDDYSDASQVSVTAKGSVGLTTDLTKQISQAVMG